MPHGAIQGRHGLRPSWGGLRLTGWFPSREKPANHVGGGVTVTPRGQEFGQARHVVAGGDQRQLVQPVGASLAQTRENLQRHATQVKRLLSPDEPKGIGLWLSANSARELVQAHEVESFAAWLQHDGLLPYTFNGFPFGDFHEQVV